MQRLDPVLQPASSTCPSRPVAAGLYPPPMVPLKDQMLSRLAQHANVAQFVSFGPGPDLPQRHARLRGHRPDHRFAGAADAVGALLALAWSGSVNSAASARGAQRRPVQLRPDPRRRRPGLPCAPAPPTASTRSPTRRSTSTTGASRGSPSAAWSSSPPGTRPGRWSGPARPPSPTTTPSRCWAPLHGVTPDLEATPGERVEFSVHPLVAGVRQTHTIVWEAERVDPAPLAKPLTWPNRVQPVPRRQGSSACWSPTCSRPARAGHDRGRPPGRPVRLRPPHRQRGAVDPHLPGRAGPRPVTRPSGAGGTFALLAEEDPSSTAIVSVLAQEGRRGPLVGRRPPRRRRRPAGRGRRPGPARDFMLARAAPATLGAGRRRRAAGRVPRRRRPRPGPLRVGPRRGRHLGRPAPPGHGGGVRRHSTRGRQSRWRRFDPSLGLERLRELIATVPPRRRGRTHRRRRRHAPTPATCPPGGDPRPGWPGPRGRDADLNPASPVPSRPAAYVAVRLTCMFTTDVCFDVQEYAHRL